MQIYALKLNNFLRFGDKDNTVVFDLSPEQKKKLNNNEITMDQIYESVKKDPIKHINEAKSRGLENQLGIIGVIDGDSGSSNGAGKSSILEAICYAHYEMVVRRNVNTNKSEKAGLSVVTKVNNKYLDNLKESYVEEVFENNGKIYRLKRGRSFSKSQKSSSPLLEFECINEDSVDSRNSHRSGDTKDSISDVITMDYEVFVNTQMFGQNDAGKFLTGTDKTKKEMLISLLHLENVVVGCLDIIRKNKNEKQKDLSVVKSNVSFLQNSMLNKYDNLHTEKKEFFEEEILNKIRETIENKKANFCSDILKIESLKRKKNEELGVLQSDENIKKSEEIKKEEFRIRQEFESKDKVKEDTIKEWKLLKDKLEEEKEFLLKENVGKEESLAKSEKEFDILSLKLEKIGNDYEDKLDLKKKDILCKLKEEPEIKDKINNFDKKNEELVGDLAKLNSKKEELLEENILLSSQIKDGKNEFICKSCKSKVSKDHIEEEISKNKDKISKIENVIIDIEKNKKIISESKSLLNNKISDFSELKILNQKIETQRAKFINSKDRLSNLKNAIDNYKKDIKNVLEKIEKINSSNKGYDEKIKEILDNFEKETKNIELKLQKLRDEYKMYSDKSKNIQESIAKLEKEILAYNKEVSTLNEEVGRCDAELISHKDNCEKLKELSNDLKEKEKICNRYLLLESVYGLEGVQTKIVQKFLPILNVYIKEFLDILSKGSLNVDIYVSKKSKIEMSIIGGSANIYEMLSGGEKMLIRLAVDIGLSLLSFTRSSQKPEIICLDEIFGCLDDKNKKSVFEILNRLSDKFSRVIMISHDKEICERIKSNLIIEKSSGNKGLSRITKIQ